MTIASDQEIAPSYDRESTIIAMVTARAWRDPGYKARVLREPREVLAEEGLEFPQGIEVKAVADTPDVAYIILDRDLADAAEAAAFLTPKIQAPGAPRVRLAAPEIRLVQNTADLRYIAIPAPPWGDEPGEMTQAELLHAAWEVQGGFTFTNTNVSVSTVTTSVSASVQSTVTFTTIGVVTQAVGVTTVE
jgi:hypothetical protein